MLLFQRLVHHMFIHFKLYCSFRNLMRFIHDSASIAVLRIWTIVNLEEKETKPKILMLRPKTVCITIVPRNSAPQMKYNSEQNNTEWNAHQVKWAVNRNHYVVNIIGFWNSLLEKWSTIKICWAKNRKRPK